MDTLCALGHRAKSSARSVGASSFADMCQILERCKRSGVIEKARSVLDEMQILIERISTKIDKELQDVG